MPVPILRRDGGDADMPNELRTSDAVWTLGIPPGLPVSFARLGRLHKLPIKTGLFRPGKQIYPLMDLLVDGQLSQLFVPQEI